MDDNLEGKGIFGLSYDISVQIFSRCPAKTIVALRTEEDTITFTSSKYFTQQHLQFAKRDISQYQLFVSSFAYDFDAQGSSPGKPSECGSSSCGSQPDVDDAENSTDVDDVENSWANVSYSLSSFLDEEFSCFAVEYPFGEFRMSVGSVNGIFWFNFNHDDNLTLWNPTIGVVRRTSSWNHLVNCSSITRYVAYGFGFSELLNEYVGMALYQPNGIEFLAFIYKASTNSWQSVPSFRGLGDCVVENMIRSFLDIVFVAGKFHWLVKMNGNHNGMNYILSLDPVTKLYDIIEKPINDLVTCSYLGEMGTCLCWCVMNEEDLLEWDVWMWEDHTWSIAFQLPPFSNFTANLKPMGKLPDGQLLLKYDNGLVCCDVNNDTYRVVELPEISNRLISCCQLYLETLVSPAHIVTVDI